MRKPFLILFITIICLLTGCENKEPPVPIREFEGQMHIDKSYTGGQFDIDAQVSFLSEGVGEIFVTSPDELCTLCFSWDECFDMSYQGLHCQTEKGYLPHNAFAQAVYAVINDLEDSKCQSFSEGTATFVGVCESGEYTLITDRKGYVQNISIEEINLSADFTYN